MSRTKLGVRAAELREIELLHEGGALKRGTVPAYASYDRGRDAFHAWLFDNFGSGVLGLIALLPEALVMPRYGNGLEPDLLNEMHEQIRVALAYGKPRMQASLWALRWQGNRMRGEGDEQRQGEKNKHPMDTHSNTHYPTMHCASI